MAPELGDLLAARMLERRVVSLHSPLDASTASRAATEMMALDADGDRPVTLRLDVCGGTLDDAFTVVDTVDLMGVDVWTHALGRLEGPAIAVLAVGNRRWVAPHAVVRLSDGRTGREGSYRQLEAWAEDIGRQRERFIERLACACGRRREEVTDDLDAGRGFLPEEAVDYGLADEVGSPRLP